MNSTKFKYSHSYLCITLASLSFTGALHAYQPGKWSPMDAYIESGKKGGPKRLVVKDASGKTLEISDFNYDNDGRLIEEKFLDPSGKYRGNIEYVYEKGKISLETLKDESGKIISKKEFRYHAKSMEIVVVDPKGTTLIRHQIRHDNMKISGGKEINGNITDQFTMSYDKQGRMSVFRMIRKDGSSLSEISFTYDETGKLVSRTLKDESGESICKYEYDSKGNLISYVYYNNTDGKLLKDKYLEFFFNENNSNVLSSI